MNINNWSEKQLFVKSFPIPKSVSIFLCDNSDQELSTCNNNAHGCGSYKLKTTASCSFGIMTSLPVHCGFCACIMGNCVDCFLSPNINCDHLLPFFSGLIFSVVEIKKLLHLVRCLKFCVIFEARKVTM